MIEHSDVDASTGTSTADPSPYLSPELTRADEWSDGAVAAAGIEVRDTPVVSVGGGMGSFVFVDYLRIAGRVPAADIRVLSRLGHPWQTYEHLARSSQVTWDGRIRSDSASRPDNIWGFPSYALEEAARERSIEPVRNVLLEPVLADFYTPRLSALLAGLEREAKRIRYWDMLVRGDVRAIRRRIGGGYFAVIDAHDGPVAGSPDAPRTPVAFRCRDVHIAVGYPRLCFLPDLQRFRQRFDVYHVVNAYENHEHVYQALQSRPGTVLVRGAGIVASQVLNRLISTRLRGGTRVRILHLFRTYVDGPHGDSAWSRRPGGHGFAYQGFNYPKSVWGGQLRAQMHDLEGHDRIRAYEEIGGTTTPWRQRWEEPIEEARAAGWYQAHQGTVADFRLEDDRVVARLNPPHDALELRADYVIDCTGLDGDVTEHRVLRDLLEHGGAGRNPLGYMDVERTFELRGTRSGDGRIYVTGVAAYGGYFSGVDTFLGLQIGAQEIVDDLAERGHCDYMGPLRSTVEWFKWAVGREV